MDETLEKRLLDAGIAETEAGATIVPDAKRGPSDRPALPRMRVDLGTHPGTGSAASPLHPPPDLEAISVLGEGGMGRVFVARQHSLGRDVAVKTTKRPDDAASAATLIAEAMKTGQLEHPGIVPVHALGEADGGRPAIVMKRIDGVLWRTLADDAEHAGWEGWEGTSEDRTPGHLQILMQLCNAVRFAHSRGTVHRDIKLDNVLIGRFGDVYLADWGIATDIGHSSADLCGTPGYVAPEMVNGDPVDERTDVYLLGATLHEILTGEMRHHASTSLAAVLKAAESEPHEYSDTVPAALAQLVNDACHRDPLQRPAGAQAFRDRLAQYLDHRQAMALARESVRLVEELEALPLDSEDVANRERADRLIAQATFGFERALSDWQGDDETLAARQRFEALVQRRRERAAKLEAQARERDPIVGAKARGVAFTVLGVCGVAVSGYALTVGGTPTPVDLLLYASGFYLPVIVLTVALWKRLITNQYSRRLLLLFHGLFAIMVLHRVIGVVEAAPIAVILGRDALMQIAIFGAMAIAVERWFVWISVCFGAAFLACTLVPEFALFAYALAAGVVLLIAAGFQFAMLRPPAGEHTRST